MSEIRTDRHDPSTKLKGCTSVAFRVNDEWFDVYVTTDGHLAVKSDYDMTIKLRGGDTMYFTAYKLKA